MKLGVAIEADSVEALRDRAATLEATGIEIVWLPLAGGDDTGLLRAAIVASGTSFLRIAGSVPVGIHPLEIAEACAVTDNCSNGRLILILEDRLGDEALIDETVDVVLTACAPTPFRHDGNRWRIPANLDENDQHERRVIVTPLIVQTELPVWLCGAAAAAVARARGLRHVTPIAVSKRTRDERPILELDVDSDARGLFDTDRLVTDLLECREARGVDIALLRLPAGLENDAWTAAVDRLARHVRPRVLMDALPPGLEEHWRVVLPG